MYGFLNSWNDLFKEHRFMRQWTYVKRTMNICSSRNELMFFFSAADSMTMTDFTSQIIYLFTASLHTFCDFFLGSFTALSACSCISLQVQRKYFFRLSPSNHEKTLRREPCGWKRKASFELFNVYGATLSSSSVAICPYCICVAFWYCRTLWCQSSIFLLLQGHEDVSSYKAILAWWFRSCAPQWHCPWACVINRNDNRQLNHNRE